MSAFPPPTKALTAAVKITVVVLVPLVVAVLVLGGRAVVPATMALLSVTFSPYCSSRQTIALSAALVLVGGLATAVNGNPVAVVAVVVASCLLAGLSSRLSAGVFGVAPVVAAVLGMDPPRNPTLTVMAVMAAVSLYVLVVVRLLKVHLDRDPVPFDVAIRHAVVMAVACGSATAVALYYDLPKGYWLVMTLAIVLRPYAVDSLAKNRQRIVGTIAGAVVAAAMSPLPRPMQVVFAAICMTLMFAYATLGDYVLQVTFMTPMVVFLISTGAVDDTLSIDGLRVLYTVGACVAGGLVSMALVRGPDARSVS
ncbi:MAG: FUSC family protein [Candidatus Nanopelagicales bacterium]|nr:FUSC family protein [Candidatus Nanopelagicales bacterium]